MKLYQKSLFIMIIFCFFSSKVISQNKLIDSLKNELKKDITDIKRAKVLGDLTWYNKAISIDSSLKYGYKALTLLEKIDDKKMLAQQYSDMAGVFMVKGDYKKSKSFYLNGIKLRTQLKDTLGIAKIEANLSSLYTQLQVYDSAMVYGVNSMRVFEQKGHIQYANILKSNIASLYDNMKIYDKALEYHYDVLAYYKTKKDKSFLANLYNNIGKTLSYKGDTIASINAYKKAFVFAKESNNVLSLGVASANLGNTYTEQGKFQKAIIELEKSLKYRKQLNSEREIASLQSSLGILYFKISKLQQAKKYFNEALPYFEKYKTKNKLSDIYYHLTIIAAYEQNSNKVSFYSKKSSINSSSLSFEKSTIEITELETKYQTEKKEKEIAKQKEQILEQELAIKNRNLYAILLASALLIIAIIFISVYKRNQLKRKQLQKEIDLKDALTTIKTQNRLQEQRLRISRDLHDNIGSQLTFIISSIDNLKFISKDANSKLKEKLAIISSFTGETIHQLRDTIWAMNKNEISIEDIHARVLSFIEKAKTATENIHFDVQQELTEKISLSSLKGMNVFRVIQEAINNSIKYANASKIVISISKKDKDLQVSIKDNGLGFDIKKVELGNGLSNMEKRMNEINGKIIINSKVDSGTHIQIICKL